jgi:hypothetical protein
MAVATTTALAIGGLAISAGSTAMSFAQANKQNQLQRRAEADAAMAMAEARKKLEINYAKQLAVQKEPYELQREALLSQGAMSLEAAREADRGAEATAGRLQMAQTEGQAAIRGAMGAEMQKIDEQIAAESSRLRDLGAQIDLEEAAGAQLAARDAAEARAQAMQEGFQGVASTLQQGLEMVPLFEKSAAARQAGKMQKEATKAGLSQGAYQKAISGYAETRPEFSALQGVGGMDEQSFTAAMSAYTPEQLKKLQAGYKQKLGTDISSQMAPYFEINF